MKRKAKIAVVAVVVIAAVLSASALLSSPSYVPLPRMEHMKGSGAVGAVEIVEYSDFQCPACGAAYVQLKTFLQGNSSAMLVYRHFPLTQIHPFASKAAEASECASDQGKFWEYHDRLFENQQRLYRADLGRYAEEIGLDAERFAACLDSGVMAGRVSADAAEATSSGVRATPTFFIDGRKYEGVLTVQQLGQAVK